MREELLLAGFRKYISLTPAEEQEVLAYVTGRNFNRGDFINAEGEVNRYTNFITGGSARVYYTGNDGGEHVVQLGVTGWWVSDFPSFITQTPATMYTQALEKTSILAISYPDLQVIYERVPKMERFFRLLIQQAYAGFHKRTQEVLSLSAEQRYRSFVTAYPDMEQCIAQKHIASYLGMSPEFLSTLKKRMLEKERRPHSKS